jgi:SOS-response transcriptional repressor LexA
MNKKSKQGKDKRQEIMEFLLENQVVLCPSSFSEIADGVGLKSVSAVSHHLKILEQEGRIKRPANSYRHIQIVKTEESENGKSTSPTN